MKRLRHIGVVTLTILGICIISAAPLLAQPSSKLQPFSAEYQLNRGDMLIGKVTHTLRLERDGSYSYTSTTKPVGIVAVFSDDLIIETSEGQITNSQVVPSIYTYEHQRKKHPKFRKQQFDWTHNRLSVLAPKPEQSMDIPKGTQDKASMILAMMLTTSPTTKDINLQVADQGKVKEYQMISQGQEQIRSGGSDYHAFKLVRAEPDQKPTIAFWLAPELDYLPVQIEKTEKKDTYTMVLVKYTKGQPAPANK